MSFEIVWYEQKLHFNINKFYDFCVYGVDPDKKAHLCHPIRIYTTTKCVFKNHSGGKPKVVFEGRWSLITCEFVLEIRQWNK
jgi:hypothetical protein